MLTSEFVSWMSTLRPVAMTAPSPPERQQRVAHANDGAGARRSLGRLGVSTGRKWLNDEERGPWPIDGQGERTVGGGELGAGHEPGDRQAVGLKHFLVGSNQVDALKVQRPGTKAEHDGPVRRRATQVFDRAEPQARTPRPRDSDELIAA